MKRGSDLNETNTKIREVRDVVDQERQVRQNDLSGIVDRVEELTRNMREDQSQWLELQREVSEGLAQVRQGLVLEQKDRAAVDAELAASVKEARVWVEREAQAREKGDMSLSKNLNTVREAVEDVMQKL